MSENINENNIKTSAGMKRLKKLLENVKKAESKIGKFINSTKDGFNLVCKVAKHYNTLAQLVGLPQIPFDDPS